MKAQKGLTLVELMIAMTLGLLLIGGVLQIFLSSKQTFRVTESAARMQESGRFAVETLSRDVRQAGAKACFNDDYANVKVIANNPPFAEAANTPAVRGYDDISAAGSEGYVTGTDRVVLHTAEDCGATITGNTIPANANIQVANAAACNFAANDIIIVTDCTKADMFRATNVSSGNGTVTIAHAENSNAGNRLSGPYAAGSRVLRQRSVEYAVRTDSRTGGPTLSMRTVGQTTNGAWEPVATDVEDMQLFYGIDDDEDGSADRMLTAGAVATGDWPHVVAVNVALRLRSPEDSVASEAQAYESYANNRLDAPASVTPNDRRIRKNLVFLVNVRNRSQ